jgi:hypothetical protein
MIFFGMPRVFKCIERRVRLFQEISHDLLKRSFIGIGKAAEYLCSKQLAQLRQWLERYEKRYGKLDARFGAWKWQSARHRLTESWLRAKCAKAREDIAPRLGDYSRGRFHFARNLGRWIGLDIWRPIRWLIAEKA